MFPNAGILAAGVLTGPTRDEFIAHITTKAVDGSYAANSGVAMEGASKSAFKIISTPTSAFGVLRGSSWGVDYYADGFSVLNRIMLHGLPSAAAFNDLVSSATPVYLEVRSVPDYYPEYYALNRNGYPSLALAAGNALACWVFELIYWDGAQPMRMKPFDQSGPTPYTW